jgi:hypothetical protein
MINELEDELAETKLAMDEWVREKQQYQQYIENMQLEKEEMVRAHTIETGDLRKKVSVLTEHVQKMESTAMSTVPSSTGFTADYSDIDTLTMDGAWDSISFLNDFASDNDACIKPESAAPVTLSLTLPKKAEGSDDKPAAQGLLLMLLLCGAFVASKGITSTASAGIPVMSDDVRAASTTLLQDIFKDAGVAHGASASLSNVLSEASAPRPSDSAWSAENTISMSDFATATSSLTNYADSLAQPTEEQKHEQLFSLTAAQYNGVASPDFLRNAPTATQSTSQGRRNLADTLASMRRDSKESAAEVYTRSLLWDQVPADVVRDFARMVGQHNAVNAEEVAT